MLWIVAGSVVVILGAGLSLWASLDSRRDIAGGRPRFCSVADVTGICQRERLDAVLGERDAEDRYRATAEDVRNIGRSAWKRLFDSEVGDLACIAAAIAAPLVYGAHLTLSVSMLSFAGAYVVIGYVGAIVIAVRNGILSEATAQSKVDRRCPKESGG